ncbi:hypothetical protein ACIBG8_25670 [Nonomuraea sp. NPDC050556]|uniref:hypothetical protein n=1 Tax=Nonomuraea sp. NPDC050556 TaxID=3364369 RepID=UPI0037A8E0BE
MAKYAFGLMLLSPLVAEFLLGNIPITMLVALVALVPLYGGGALLIREVARRRGLGWPGIVLLALAYAVLEEGLVTQSLFNPSWAGLRMLDYGWVPALGMGAWWTVFVLAIHSVWSICVPIALMESLARSDRPWLGKVGLTVVSLVFVLGIALSAVFMNATPYLPSVPQLVGTGVVIVGLVAAALLWRPAGRPLAARAPSPWVVLGLTLVAGVLFWAPALVYAGVPAWVSVAWYLVLYGTAAVLIARWSRSAGWGGRHTLALAGGGLLTYAWHGFAQPPAVPAPAAVDLAGNAFFVLAAVALLLLAARRTASAVL